MRFKGRAALMVGGLLLAGLTLGFGGLAQASRTDGPCITSGDDGPTARRAFSATCRGAAKDCDPYKGKVYCFSRTVTSAAVPGLVAAYEGGSGGSATDPATNGGPRPEPKLPTPAPNLPVPTPEPKPKPKPAPAPEPAPEPEPTPAPEPAPEPEPAPAPEPANPAVAPPREPTTQPKTAVQRRTSGAHRPGDAGVSVDRSKFDSRFPQMEQWAKAGARNGVPAVSSLQVKATVNGGSSADINRAIEQVARSGGGTVLLKDGRYRIDRTVDLKSNVTLLGESRNGTVAAIHMNGGNGFRLYGIANSGIHRMTIQGSWGKPSQEWNIGTRANNELPGNTNVSVMVKDSRDTWLDDVNIYNSGDFPIRVASNHTTLRGLDVDGVHNKHGGAHGYFFILGGHNLLTQSKITRLRHLSLQGDDVEYNVVYDNDFAQELSFHAGDDGNNLLENNRIILPADMPNGGGQPDYRAVMGSWSRKHRGSKRDNFLWNNTLIERNHGGDRWGSGAGTVFAGPIYDTLKGDQRKNFPAMNITPRHGTLYAVDLG